MYLVYKISVIRQDTKGLEHTLDLTSSAESYRCLSSSPLRRSPSSIELLTRSPESSECAASSHLERKVAQPLDGLAVAV